jgi:hypothetical protein
VAGGALRAERFTRCSPHGHFDVAQFIDLVDMLVPGTLAGDRMVGYDDSPNESPS